METQYNTNQVFKDLVLGLAIEMIADDLEKHKIASNLFNNPIQDNPYDGVFARPVPKRKTKANKKEKQLNNNLDAQKAPENKISEKEKQELVQNQQEDDSNLDEVLEQGEISLGKRSQNKQSNKLQGKAKKQKKDEDQQEDGVIFKNSIPTQDQQKPVDSIILEGQQQDIVVNAGESQPHSDSLFSIDDEL